MGKKMSPWDSKQLGSFAPRLDVNRCSRRIKDNGCWKNNFLYFANSLLINCKTAWIIIHLRGEGPGFLP